MLGGGGSVLTVPVFVYVLGFDAKEAIAMTLPVVGVTSLVGAASHWRAGTIRIPTGFLFGAAAMTGSFLSARFLAPLVSGQLQLFMLASVMLAASFSMYRGGLPGHAHRARVEPVRLVTVALAVGALTGLVGIGGGFLIVPALVLLAGIPMKEAVGTSLLVIALNTFSGWLGYADQTRFQWGFLAVFTLVAIAGILVGARLVPHVPAARLKRAFAIFLLFVAAFVLYQNRQVLLG
jgi:uncharacterized membrane protein YfcA